MNYIVSTIQYNALVNKNLLRNMLTFADRHDVRTIYLYVMPGTNKEETILPTFDDERIEYLFLGKEGMKLNNNLKLHDTAILASQINPLTGFSKKLHRDYCYILPSPKIRFEPVANTSKYPRFLATTGALTHGNYKLHTAQGRKAELEHQYGFAYIKIRSNQLFDYRPITAKKNGNFHYNRENYRFGKIIHGNPEALVLGDWHVGDLCPHVRKVSIQMIKDLNPKRVVWHDLFNGHSINHHEQENHLSKVMSYSSQRNNLEDELNECLKEVWFFANKFPDQTFVVAESNHDQFLLKYLADSHFQKDAPNARIACRLFDAHLGKPNQPILKTALELVGNLPDNVIFLREDDEYRVQGVNIGAHGHRGVNGARGSGASFDRFNLKQITGHQHSPVIYANGMVVGTSTKLKLSYTKGPSSWMNAHGILYSDGTYSLHIIL